MELQELRLLELRLKTNTSRYPYRKSVLGKRFRVARLQDRNDNAPHFSRTEFVFSVRENNAVGAPVGELELVDADAEPSATDVLRLVPRMQPAPAHWPTGLIQSGTINIHEIE